MATLLIVEISNVNEAMIIKCRINGLTLEKREKIIMTKKVKTPSIPFKKNEFAKKFGAFLGFAAISLITINPTPKSGRKEKIAIVAVT